MGNSIGSDWFSAARSRTVRTCNTKVVREYLARLRLRPLMHDPALVKHP